MTIKTHTYQTVIRDIGIINLLRTHPNTKDIYANVDSSSYASYQQWLTEWDLICSNPILMEESCLGNDTFELDFTFMPSDATLDLIKLYLTETCGWKVVSIINVEHKLQLTIKG